MGFLSNSCNRSALERALTSISCSPPVNDAGVDRSGHAVHSESVQGSTRKPVKATAKARILILDEDNSLSKLLSSELGSRGFAVDHLEDAGEAIRRLKEGNQYDLFLLELNLTSIDGIALLKALRRDLPKLPIFVITSRSRIEDKVQALQSGADDCMLKPLSLAELFARIDALLRRNANHAPNVQTVADLTLSREEHRVERNGRRILLTPREFDLLEVMMQNAGRPVSRVTLLEKVWNLSSEPSTNIVDVYMKYVRDKVDQPDEKKLIRTIRGFGYELVVSEHRTK